jgi:DNA-binding protein HU-beta
MTKSQVLSVLAERTGLPRAQVSTVLDELAKVAYSDAKNGFVLPGFGKLVMVERKARTGRNPITGETIQIPPKTVVKFRLSKACKESVLAAS